MARCSLEVEKEVRLRAMQSKWFAAYQNAIGPLLMAPPEINTATPVWVKHLQG